MNADWAVQIEDGAHAIYAEVVKGALTVKLHITWDGEALESSSLWVLAGDLKAFQRNGHSFLLSLHGLGWFGSLVLSMDGVEVPRRGVAAPAPIQFIKEIGVHESEEIVGSEEYPLDNRFGDQPFTAVHQVSHESTNELSVDTSSHLDGKVGLTILSAIKAEIEAQVSRQTGHKIGEKVTESQTLTFSVGAKSSVIYQVVWKRKVRSGERLYLSGGKSVTVPYRVYYGLSCEVRTQAHKAHR
jgi:hypothetical protein